MKMLQQLASVNGTVTIKDGIACLPDGRSLNLSLGCFEENTKMPGLGWEKGEWVKDDIRGAEYGQWRCHWGEEKSIFVSFYDQDGDRKFKMVFLTVNDFEEWAKHTL